MSYPEPDELLEYARAPVPFHDVWDFEMDEDDRLVVEGGDQETVTYTFEPTQLMIEVAESEYESVDEVDFIDLDHREAWEKAISADLSEDFVVATDIIEGDDAELHKYDAYWVLSEVHIQRPRDA